MTYRHDLDGVWREIGVYVRPLMQEFPIDCDAALDDRGRRRCVPCTDPGVLKWNKSMRWTPEEPVLRFPLPPEEV